MNNFPFPILDEKEKNEIIRKKNEINKKKHEALRNIFKNDIKGSFLISILNKVYDVLGNSIFQYYPNAFNITDIVVLQGADERIDFDICQHIVGIHKFNTLFLSNEEKGSLQKDTKYIEKLCHKVCEHIKLRYYGSSFFVNRPLMVGDQFVFFPLSYDIFVLTTYLFEKLPREELQKDDFYMFYNSMLSQSAAILTLVENGLLNLSYPQVRNLIELFFKYEVLYINKSALKEYNLFCDYQIEYLVNNRASDEFNKKYKSVKKNVSFSDYLNYGWIDSIVEFNYLEGDKHYSIPGIYNYLKMVNKNTNYFDSLKELHNRCHALSHGNTITKTFTLESYFELIPNMALIIKALLIDISNIIKERPIIEGIDIIDKFDKDLKDFNDKIRTIKREDILKYYNIEN